MACFESIQGQQRHFRGFPALQPSEDCRSVDAEQVSKAVLPTRERPDNRNGPLLETGHVDRNQERGHRSAEMLGCASGQVFRNFIADPGVVDQIAGIAFVDTGIVLHDDRQGAVENFDLLRGEAFGVFHREHCSLHR